MANGKDAVQAKTGDEAQAPDSSRNGSSSPTKVTTSAHNRDDMASEQRSPDAHVPDDGHDAERVDLTPPLPPRPSNLDLLDERNMGSVRLSKRTSRPVSYTHLTLPTIYSV